MSRHASIVARGEQLWIVKPSASSQGRASVLKGRVELPLRRHLHLAEPRRVAREGVCSGVTLCGEALTDPRLHRHLRCVFTGKICYEMIGMEGIVSCFFKYVGRVVHFSQ